MILVLITIVWSIFFWRLVKWLRQVANGHKHLQVAAADAFAGGIRTDCDQVIRNLERLRQNMIRLENQHAHNAIPFLRRNTKLMRNLKRFAPRGFVPMSLKFHSVGTWISATCLCNTASCTHSNFPAMYFTLPTP